MSDLDILLLGFDYTPESYVCAPVARAAARAWAGAGHRVHVVTGFPHRRTGAGGARSGRDGRRPGAGVHRDAPVVAPSPLPRTAPMPLWRRARVLARRGLFAGLRAVPPHAVDAVHRRWIGVDGRRRAPWRPVAALLFYRPLDHDAFTVPGGRGERMTAVGSRLERVLWWYGEQGYEPSEAGWWRALCAGSESVLEIGANVGYYSVVGARAAPPGAYTAVEANPEAAAVVRRNLDLNGLGATRVVTAAVVGAGGPDEVDLALPDQEAHSTAPTGSFLPGAEGVADRTSSRSVRVRTVPAAPLFTGQDLVKLDIEGFEAAVLGAALPQIRHSRPVLLVEVLAGATRLHAVLRGLVEDGWTVHAVGRRLSPLPPGEIGGPGDRDLLLVPAEKIHRLPVRPA